MKKLISLFTICIFAAITLAASGCAVLHTQHPVTAGSTVQAPALDSETYNLLLLTKGIIDGSKVALAPCPVPPVANCGSVPQIAQPIVKLALNDVILSYNVLDSSFQAYHQAVLAGSVTAEQTAVVQNASANVKAATEKLAAAKPAGSSKLVNDISQSAKSGVESQTGLPVNYELIPMIEVK